VLSQISSIHTSFEMSWEDGPFLESAFAGNDLAVAVSFQRLGGLPNTKLLNKTSGPNSSSSSSTWSGHAVQWNQTVRFRVIPSIYDMSDEERRDLWWTADDLVHFASNEIRRRKYRCVPLKTVARASSRVDPSSFCTVDNGYDARTHKYL